MKPKLRIICAAVLITVVPVNIYLGQIDIQIMSTLTLRLTGGNL